MKQLESGIWVPDTPNIFIKPTEEVLSQRRLEGLQKLSEIKQWGLRNPTKFMERFIGVELLDVQNYTFMGSWNKMYALWLCTRNYGKDLALDTPVPTISGMKLMGDIKPGDYVLDRFKKPTEVLKVSDIFVDNPCYKLNFSNGDKIISGAGHLWQVRIRLNNIIITGVYETQVLYNIIPYTSEISVPSAGSQGINKIISIEKAQTVPTKCISVDNSEELFLCGEYNTVTHNSTLLALYYMTRGMLLNNCRCYICAGTSDQSIETFEKIVSIAKNEIESFTGLTDVFRNEVVINMGNNDGFIRNPAGFTYKLYNGSFVKTLNSNINAKRGKRSECLCFDESSFLDEEVFQVLEPYTAQDKDFKMGGGVNVTTLPRELPNQLLYTSSASTTDSYFYNKYKEYSKAMIWGSKDHFVADVNCEIMFNATYRGKIYPTSLLTKEKVENAMRENKEKALREYYNIFTSDGGADAIFKRSMIVKNSTIRPPIMFNDTKDRLFALSYDPARSLDNSFVLIGEYYKDSSDNWRMRIANGVNFMDLSKKNKTPMRTPEQVTKLKELILDYNGDGVDDYSNIHALYIDAGSGGGGINIADYLMEDWYEKGHEGDRRYLHRGLIDKIESADYVKKFPNAVDKIKLLTPSAYKSVIYEAAIEMMRLDLVDFTAEYDNKGYLTMLEIDEKELNKIKQQLVSKYKDKDLTQSELDRLIEEELEERNFANTKVYKLSPDEELGLTQIDALKEEMVNMVRKKRESGKDGFELTTEKQNKLHDDRSYCFAMLCYGLSELRREHIKNKKRPKKENIANAMPIRKGKVNKMFG